jgi:hypothetical protein
LTLSNQEIVELIESFERDSKALIKHIHQLVWHQRGGMTLDEAFAISHTDRELITELIKDRMETTKESRLPYF